MAKPNPLKLVPPSPAAKSIDIYAYESEARQRIASRNWAAVHIRGDRNAPVFLPERRRGWLR